MIFIANYNYYIRYNALDSLLFASIRRNLFGGYLLPINIIYPFPHQKCMKLRRILLFSNFTIKTHPNGPRTYAKYEIIITQGLKDNARFGPKKLSRRKVPDTEK